MDRIDSHQHFWRYHPVKDAWITEDMAAIQRDFLPSQLKPLMDAHRVSGCVAVQADQSEMETLFLLELAEQHPFIRGVVGWVDLQAPDVADRLAHFCRFPKFKGVRHIVQGEQDPRFLLRPEFMAGIEALAPHGLTYDILVKPHQLEATAEFVANFPGQPFVIDHLAKPYMKAAVHEPWATQLADIAAYGNVCCKLSGMVTEADWAAWKPADFAFYIQHVFAVFGPHRVLFGSDWPVCNVAAPYGEVVGIVERAIDHLPPYEQELIWHTNAVDFYHL
ncbi:amidohydrolase family protein [Parapedobacter sp.]